ncbi:MAG: SCO family protein [Verrucomicrobiota bacterium]
MRVPRRLPLFASLLALLGAAGCGSRTTVYDVRGEVREIQPAERTVVVRHDEIPGYMAAMTMPFDVRDTNVLRGIQPGDVVAFRLHVQEKDSWADSFQVQSNAGPAAATPRLNDPSAVSFYKDVPELNPGDLLPDYTLTDQLGRTVRLSEFRGQALAMTFIFTRCPLPDFCPRLTERFTEVAQRLKEKRDAPRNWRLLSVSFDPLHDTPETLRKYGERWKYDPSVWTLATGSFEQIQPLGSHFGLYFAREVTPDNMNHNLRTVVIDPRGRLKAVFIGNSWSAEELAEALVQAAGS